MLQLLFCSKPITFFGKPIEMYTNSIVKGKCEKLNGGALVMMTLKMGFC